MRKVNRLAILSVIGGSALGAKLWWPGGVAEAWNAPDRLVIADRTRARLRALDVTERALNVAPDPTGWDAGVFVSTAKLSEAISHAVVGLDRWTACHRRPNGRLFFGTGIEREIASRTRSP